MGESVRYDRFSYSPVTTPEDMAARVMPLSPATDAEALKLLRASFPDRPLSARVAALTFMQRRRGDGAAPFYSPR